MYRRLLLLVSLAISCLPAAKACSAFALTHEAAVLFGRNNDYYSLEGRIHVNRRGLEKTAFWASPAAHWVSRYGSVTHTQWGLEFPCGGMNEAGLVVENMSLTGTIYPTDNRPALIELQWIQYQLDCSASIDDVLANDDRVRITADSTPLHFLVTDASGRSAIIEFIGGRRTLYSRETLPVAALTNSSYAESLTYEAGTSPAQETKTSSLSRFVRAAAAVREFSTHGASDPVAYGFGILENVTQPSLTLWSVLYDVSNQRMHFRSRACPQIKTVPFAALDFRPTAQTKTLDINTVAGGEIVPSASYTRADNLAVLLKVGRETPATAAVATSYWEQRASYPDTVRAITPPNIQSHPTSVTVAPGGSAQFTVSASGEGPLSYQWFKNDLPIEGATNAVLDIPSATTADAGDFTVHVGNPGDVITSRFARLVVATPVAGGLGNLSVRSPLVMAGQPLILGLVVRGGSSQLLLRAVGPTLRTFGVADAVADCRIEIHAPASGEDRIVAANDNWAANAADRETLIVASRAVGAFPLPESSRDAALVLALANTCTLHVWPVPAGASGVVLAEAYDLGGDPRARLVNLSCRNVIVPASAVIAGVLLRGNTPARLLIRGVGPGLASLGVGDALPRPRLEVHTTMAGRDVIVASNEGWTAEPGAAEAAREVGAFALPADSRDTTLVLTLPSGAYSAVLASADGSSGTVLMEIYEL